MKRSIHTFVLFSAIVAFTVASCEKTPIRGCKNSKADNFKADAEEDDGSCKYTADFNFAISSVIGTNMTNGGLSTLTFFVDNQQIGSLTPTQTVSSFPACSATKNILKKTMSFTSPVSSIKILIKDSKNGIQYDKTESLNLKSSGLCNTFFLQ